MKQILSRIYIILFILLLSAILLFQAPAEETGEVLSAKNSEEYKNMVYIPAGEFLMGSPSGDGDSDEHPQHKVYLDAYYIDKYEVTNWQYRLCVEAGVCTPPENKKYYDNSSFTDHPVVFVSWDQANIYAKWAGKRLPTEAEWEKAASWDQANKKKLMYPWGDDFMTKENRCNWDERGKHDGYNGTAPAGSFPSGASPYGVMDMAGNVWEWCADWYNETYYDSSPDNNPKGPSGGEFKVLRGGSWWYGYSRDLRSTYRWGRLGHCNDFWGFRCAR